MRSRRVSLSVVVFIGVLLSFVVGAGIVFGTPASMSTPSTKTASTHTLVITATNGSGSYTVTASGSLHLTNGDQSEYQLRGPRVTGTVGTGDATDVIRYTGYIESFQIDGSIRVTLDGQQIAPQILGGQHIQIRRPSNASQSIDYHFSVTGQVAPGELAEQADTATERRIRGHVRETADSFYFTGEIDNDSITVSGPVHIQINGQNASVFLTHAPPTPPTTPTPPPTPTVSPSTPTVSPPDVRRSSSPPVTVTSSPPTSVATHSPPAPSSSGSFGGQFMVGLGGGLLLVVGAIAVLVLRD
jgi:hypothetical protein